MKTLCIIVFYIFFLSLFCLDQVSPISIYTLTPSQSLKDGQNLTSHSETFDLGFFSPSANSRNRYLGIWYKKVPLQTVVWVANRESPLNDSSGVLMISSTGNLVILNGRNHTIWSTNSSKIAENPIIEFLESGNLILKDRNSDEYLWQSFHHPSDAFLPSMKLGSDTSIGMNNYLTSWKSSDDPSPGDYTYEVNLNPYPELSMRNRSNKFYRSGPWNGLRNSGQPELNNNASFVYKDDADDKKAYLTFQLVSKDFITRLTLKQIGNTGVLQRLTWVVNRSQIWVQDYQIPRDQCDNYRHCGVGSICDTHEVPRCKCLPAFEPTSPFNWREWDWSRGCQRKTPLNCAKGDGFIKCREVKLPDTTNTWLNMSMSLEECKDKCLKDCSCMAYANSDIQKNGTGCAMWFIDLIDIRKLSGAGQDLYIRVAASDAAIDESNETESDPASNKKQTTIIVISISVILIIFLIALLSYIIRKKKVIKNITKDSAEQRVHKDQIQDPPVYDMFLHARKEFPGENNDDLELNFFEMDTIVKATYNFSNTNMLGQGGFGCVYKGTLEDGQIIAVKRLSKNSGQGVDEFKNEVMLIARLQHRNLVRLLGYCVEWEEKILVYEYMENKGLDAILFNKAFKIILDWPKRFNIVIGISRGLLYLHQDSRFRIIHRDLKTSNVLLDGDLNPKISDFGMARIFGGDETEAKTKRIVGTYGYMSPEYAMDGLFSVKSDVFSFGVLVLEIISGTKNKGFFSSNSQHNLLGYAWRLWKEGQEFDLIDETVKDSCMQNEALRCIHIGLLCVQERAEDRPTMSSVVLMLSTDTALPEPKEPGFWFGKSPDKTNSASSKRKLHSVNDVTVTLLEAR